MEDSDTPLLDELEEGQWPSFVTELKEAAEKVAGGGRPLAAVGDAPTRTTRAIGSAAASWASGATAAAWSAATRPCPRSSPRVKEFHTLRVNEPAGFYYTTEKLRQLCDVWDRYGSGLLNLHGSTGDIILLGTTTANLQPCFDALGEIGFDLGGLRQRPADGHAAAWGRRAASTPASTRWTSPTT